MSDTHFPGSNKAFLVVLRAGAKSLHEDWLDTPYEQRSWDLVISYYDEAAFKAHQPRAGVEAVLVKGGKWNGIFKTLNAVPEHRRYSHVWFPDDDIATDGKTINRIFDEAVTFGLAVCQPALTAQSYFSHFLFMQCAAFRLRYSNYVEIMVPCLRADLLAEALPLFENTMSGYGLDYLWCRLAGGGPYKAAILDAVAVHHTRPVGSSLRGKIAETTGGTSEDEERALVANFGDVARPVPLTYAGITDTGEKIDGRFAIARRMFSHYWKNSEAYLDPSLARRKTLQLFKRQLVKSLTLTPLTKTRQHSRQDAAA